MSVHFDDALARASDEAERLAESHAGVVIVRDLLGRCRLVLDDRDAPEGPTVERDASTRESLGVFAADPAVLLASDLVDPDSLFNDPGRLTVRSATESAGEVTLVERTLIGGDWWLVTARQQVSPARLALFSFKGGVGRSTATALLARWLADVGESVLVVDLDLESPGVTSLLAPADALQSFGVVDILVESAVGNDVSSEAVVRNSVVQPDGVGQLWLLPAYGRRRPGYSYLPKLDRAYLDLPADNGRDGSLPSRLEAMVSSTVHAIEVLGRRPTVVLLDCRAGLHDLAGAALTHLSDVGLLFAADTEQTWWGYSQLFEQWQQRPVQARIIRERLKVVAALVDKTDPEQYLTRFTENAADCFSHIYDQAAAEDVDAFSPGLNDSWAPHSPLPIYFDSDLRHISYDSLTSAMRSVPIRSSYDDFVAGVVELLNLEETRDA